MNFSTECLEHLELFKKTSIMQGFIHDKMMAENIMRDLTNSTKFIMPPSNLLNVKVTTPALKLLRLPYPICAFEYTCPIARENGLKGLTKEIRTGTSSKRIALAYDCRKNVGPVPMLKERGTMPENANGILVLSLYYVDSVGLWTPSFGAGYIDEEVAGEDQPVLMDNSNIKTKMDVHILLEEHAADIFGHLPEEQQDMVLLNDVADEVAMATRACMMLNTRNLKVVKVNEAPEKLNKKRAKNKKPPFFEYHTLDIFVSNSGKRIDRKKVDFSQLQKQFNSMSVDRKWGMVMGHFKVRSTGIFWWNDHARGNPEKGIIKKDYRVKLEQPRM